MTLPGDNQQANDDAKVDWPTHPEYEILGHFEPRDGKRILKRLEEHHLSFEVQECSEIRLYGSRSLLCIYVRPEDRKKAEAVSDQDSARSRAAAGIRYVAVRGVICAVALLQMRSGVRSIPYYSDGRAMPLEFVAGIAGIVVFIGFFQRVIAIILKLRGDSNQIPVAPMHPTNRWKRTPKTFVSRLVQSEIVQRVCHDTLP